MVTGAGPALVEAACNLLNRSRLLKPAQVQAAYKQWHGVEAQSSPGEVAHFTQWLAANHYVTGYQARQLAVGRTEFFLNHYTLLELVGQGRMAGIFKGSHTLGQIVAIKILPAASAQDPELFGRFKREARMAVRLKHPNCVRTYHLGSAGGRHYIVMEFLEGETLEDVLKRRGKLPSAEAVRLVHQALMGLQHIHEQSMVHRDLKPANLMLAPPRPPGAPDDTLHSTLKILDIGVGRIVKDDADSDLQELTGSDVQLGTAEYKAPEQAQSAHNVDVRADVYSLGCVLYHALAGAPPFAGVGFEVIIRQCTEPHQPIRQREPSVPEGLERVLDMMLAKDPNRRFATPRHVADALQPYLGTPWGHLSEESSLARSYRQWVEAQPEEETTNAPTIAGRWYYARNGLTVGPVPTAKLSQLAAAGRLAASDLIWMEGDNPDVAIPAKAAIDFAAVAAKPTVQIAAAASTPTKAEMGFDPATGQILDAAKFARWQREQNARRAQEVTAAPTTADVFNKAVTHLNRWLDLERNRRPLLTGDLDYLRRHPDVERFMSSHARYGSDMLHRLWHHLQFMAENRRKYYCALG